MTCRLAAVMMLTVCVSGCGNSPTRPADAGQANPFIGVSQEVRNRIALCSGGSRVSVGVDLEAKIGKDLTGGAKISAAVKNELEGVVFAKVSEANAASVYKDYVACLERPLNK